MSRGNPNWGQTETVQWRFSIRGTNPNGDTVTLGNYMTQEEAASHYQQLVHESYYAHIRIGRLKAGRLCPI